MNLFVAVVPTDPDAVAEYEQALDQVRGQTIPFADRPHECAIWKRGGVLAASFSIHAAHAPIRKYTASTTTHFLTFNGMPLFGQPPNGDRSWAALLLEMHRDGRLDPDSMGGYFNLLVAEPGAVTAWNCLSRVEPLYWTQTADSIAIGNRASLVYALANRTTRFEYDPQALISIVCAGWQAHDLVPFRGVHLLPNGTQARISRGDIRLTSYKPYTCHELHGWDPAAQESLVGELIDELLDGVRVFAGFRNELTVNLSGGKDSRIMAAMCQAAGVPFRCVTSGQPGDREVIVAREVTAALGADHQISAPQGPQEIPRVDVFELLRQHVRQGDGTTNVHDPTYPVRLKPNTLLSGHGGECLRGGYERSQSDGSRPVVKDRAMAWRFLENLTLHNKLIFLLPDSIEAQQRMNEVTLDEFRRAKFAWENLYDYVYAKLREGRGVSNLRQAAAYGAFAFSPYLNDRVLRLGWSFPLSLRRSEILYYRILHRLNPRLANMRFSDSRWKFEQDGPGPDTPPDQWRARAPLPPTPRSAGAHSWRLGYDAHLRNTVRDYLLDNPHSRVYEIVDYDKLESVLLSPPPTAPRVLRSLYGILTVAYFLNDDWRPTQSVEPRGVPGAAAVVQNRETPRARSPNVHSQRLRPDPTVHGVCLSPAVGARAAEARKDNEPGRLAGHLDTVAQPAERLGRAGVRRESLRRRRSH